MKSKIIAVCGTVLLCACLVFGFTQLTGVQMVNSTINSTTIGATTPNTGAFTTASASGEVSYNSSDTITSSPTATATNAGWKYSLFGSGATGSYAVGIEANTEAYLLPSSTGGSWLSIFSGANLPANNATSSVPDSNAVASLGTNGKLHLTGGIQNGAGLEAVNGTGCTSAASVNASCSATVTWPIAFPNSSYKAVCQLKDQTAGGAMFVAGTGSRTTTTLVIQFQNAGANASASQYTYDCLGWQ